MVVQQDQDRALLLSNANEIVDKITPQFSAKTLIKKKHNHLRRVNSFGNKENTTKKLLVEGEIDVFKSPINRLKERQESLRSFKHKVEKNEETPDESEELSDDLQKESNNELL